MRSTGEVHDGLSGPGEPELHTGQRLVRQELHRRKRRVSAGAVNRPRAHAVRHGVPRTHVAHVPADAPPSPDPEPPQPGWRR